MLVGRKIENATYYEDREIDKDIQLSHNIITKVPKIFNSCG